MKNLQSVGIEPTLLRTCALSMRLNHSAKTAFCYMNGGVAQMVERLLCMQKAQGSIPCSSNLLVLGFLGL